MMLRALFSFYRRKKVSSSRQIGHTPAINAFVSQAFGGCTLGHPHSSSTGSFEALALAKEWFDDCMHRHPRCRDQHSREGWNPTRLIDVGSTDDPVKVIFDTSSISCVPYLTLSHCWGNAKFLQLTGATADELQQGIAVSKLPKTFQDAIQVTRQVGFQYLWIDSLCIVQNRDDLTDWLKEASLMHKVYMHAELNISATGAVDSSYGLFSDRDPERIQVHEVDLAVHNDSGHLTERQRCLGIDFRFWLSNVSFAPVNRRAWVLQERLLARRVLHFGREQLLWECAEQDAAEMFPRGLPAIIANTTYTKFKSLDPATDGFRIRAMGNKNADKRFWAHELWSRICEAYTSSRLTKPQDKLIAIAGLVKYMSAIIKDEYVAGMWARFLASDLLWHVANSLNLEDVPASRPQVYRAPTWSWASIDGIIDHGSITDEGMRFIVVDVSLQYATEDTTGLLTGGRILLKGILKRVSLIPNPQSNAASNRWFVSINGRPVTSVRTTTGRTTGGSVYLDVASSNYEGEKHLFCMEGRLAVGQQRLLYLLLLRCENVEDGTFSRIGLILSLHSDLESRFLERDEQESELPCCCWDAEERLHTIRVI